MLVIYSFVYTYEYIIEPFQIRVVVILMTMSDEKLYAFIYCTDE